MAELNVSVQGLGDLGGGAPIVVLGPNGSGKTRLAQAITAANPATAIGAQRRTWVDDSLPVQEKQQLVSQLRSYQQQWRSHAWQPTEDLAYILSDLIEENNRRLLEQNDKGLEVGQPQAPVSDTKLMRLRAMWSRIYPNRRLDISSFFPRVHRLDADSDAPYSLRQMSDGERTILYMAARVLTAEQPLLIIDEPELHLHSRLSVAFWDEAENLRPDCRFLYITHDLHFALSRRHASFLLARTGGIVERIDIAAIPAALATEILGAATLPFHTRRIFLFEGEPMAGLASEFFGAWFDGGETVAIAAGDRNSVCAAVSGLSTIGVTGAEVFGLVDRDFDPDDVLSNLTTGVTVLPVHELESIFCEREVVVALAAHSGKDGEVVWRAFTESLARTFRGNRLAHVVASRVRARVGDLLDRAFSGDQVANSVEETQARHVEGIRAIDLPQRVAMMFEQEAARVADALSGGPTLLAILPGKQVLSILADVLGVRSASELTGLVTRALDRRHAETDSPFRELGRALESALSKHLPPRRAT